jgi:hypothetical protein
MSFKIGTDPNNNLGIQRCSHLGISNEYQYLIGITILMSTCRFLSIPLLMLMIDTMHSPNVDAGDVQLLLLIKQLYMSDVWGCVVIG